MSKQEKLQLNTTSIRNLTETEMSQVGGGYTTRPWTYYPAVCLDDTDTGNAGNPNQAAANAAEGQPHTWATTF